MQKTTESGAIPDHKSGLQSTASSRVNQFQRDKRHSSSQRSTEQQLLNVSGKLETTVDHKHNNNASSTSDVQTLKFSC